MDNRCSALNGITVDPKNLLKEEVSHDHSVLNMKEERLSYKSQNIHVHTIGDPSAMYLNDIQDVSGTLNRDESKNIVPNTCDSFKKNTGQDDEYVTEELVPFTFVAVSEINEANEGHQDYRMCFDSALKDPLGEYSGTVFDVSEEKIVEQEITFQSELLVKKELEDEKDVSEFMIEEVFLTPDELTLSFCKLTSTKSNPIELRDQERGLDRNPDVILSDTFCSEIGSSDKTRDMEIQFESICEISGGVNEKKVFETGQCLNHFVGDTTGTAVLESKSELLNSGIQHSSRMDYQQDVKEENCECTSKISTPFSLEVGKKTPAVHNPVNTDIGQSDEIKKSMLGSGSHTSHIPSCNTRKQNNIQHLVPKELDCLEIRVDELTEEVQTYSIHRKSSVEACFLENHTQSHFGDIPFQCKICKCSFMERGHFKNHMRRHLEDKPYKCEICKISFSIKTSLHRHMRRHLEDKPYKCEICKISFSIKASLHRHMLRHLGDKPYECEICKMSFSIKKSLHSHMRRHLEDEPYECEICKMSFSIKSGLHNHIQRHLEDKPYECEICKMSFSIKSRLESHMLIHFGTMAFQCKICKSPFREECQLKRHMSVHSEVKTFQCEICKVSFRFKSRLKNHLLIHSGEKPFQCEICKKESRTKSNHQKHMQIHFDVKPYQCEICKSFFREKNALKVHMRMHSGDKPYQCEICRKASSTLSGHKSHMRTHSDVKPFQCEVCKSSFRERCSLKKHMRTHTGERPYHCVICKTSFKDRGQLKNHIRIHTGEKPFQCVVCQKSFRVKRTLNRHMATHTRD